MTPRDRWIADLRAIDSVYSYLSRIGNAQVTALGSPPARLHEYFAAMGETGDLDLFLDVVFLTSETGARFFLDELDDLLRSVARSVTARPTVIGPAVSGSVRWGETERNQQIGRIRFDQFLANVATKDYAIAPNRVVRGVLDAGLASAKRFLDGFGKGKVRDYAESVRDKCAAALKNPYLRDLEPLDGSDAMALRWMRGMRHKGYKTAAVLAAARAAVKSNKDAAAWGALAASIDAPFFAPISTDHLFEVYTLVKTLETLQSGMTASPAGIGLVRKGRGAVATFEQGAKTVRVHFDQSPLTMKLVRHSWYAAIMRDYPSRKAMSVRPDITIAVDDDGVQRLVFVECKNSKDPNYVGRGVYKLIGYLDDFRDADGGGTPSMTGILSVPDFFDAPNLSQAICLANPERPAFAAAVQRHAGLDGEPPATGRRAAAPPAPADPSSRTPTP